MALECPQHAPERPAESIEELQISVKPETNLCPFGQPLSSEESDSEPVLYKQPYTMTNYREIPGE